MINVSNLFHTPMGLLYRVHILGGATINESFKQAIHIPQLVIQQHMSVKKLEIEQTCQLTTQRVPIDMNAKWILPDRNRRMSGLEEE